MKLLLFDIDGTLVLSGGAGLRAMNRAFLELYDIPQAFAGIQLAGRTDRAILQDVLARFEQPWSEEVEEIFKQRYFERMEEEMPLPVPGKRIMPGILPLLEALAARPGLHLGLLTGNWRTSGYLKLAEFGLERFFPFGAFADDSGVRDELLPFAVARFAASHGRRPRPREVYVIGDTPHDIQCARPHGAIAVGVAAAAHTPADLAAHHPDYLFSDFTDTTAALLVLG
ncbi:MAG TPA: HAD family hydrolase [bacterium]|nr:HAD family hydrolase [bacterium]HPR87003.1 HAD family hydrolase [bacterium]